MAVYMGEEEVIQKNMALAQERCTQWRISRRCLRACVRS